MEVPIMNNDVQLDLDEMNEVEIGFYEPGCNVVWSQQLRTVAFMANEHGGVCHAKLPFRPKNCTAPVFMDTTLISISSLNNKNKKIHMWRVGDLEEHTPLTLEDVRSFSSDDEGDGEDEEGNHARHNTPDWLDLTSSICNDDVSKFPEKIDVSRGEAPHVTSSIQGVSNNNSEICYLEKIKSTPNNNNICIGTRDDASLVIVDVLQSKVCACLLGHLNLRGSDLKMSTSAGSPNLLMSTRGDQHARI
eukprot:scaffold239943_cov42-Attheya_sp.AAC.2